MKSNDQIKVVVRCRPMSTKEFKKGYKNVINVSSSVNSVEIIDPKDKGKIGKRYTFDAVYDFTSTQEQIYKETVKSIVDSVLQGYNATIFAYGQTGTGKTHTMEGKQLSISEKGVIPRSFHQIFEYIAYDSDTEYSVRCSYIELYQEEIKDLLDVSGTKSYELKGDPSNVYIKNLKSYVCNSVQQMENVMKRGNMNRKTGATNMNEHSSRSHAIFIINVVQTRTICDMKYVKTGKLNLVDLAGSERQAKSQSTGIRLKEATKINLSLSALGNVISALSDGKSSHIPYRNSKLTRILQDSLGGNAKTLMIANIGPACFNYIESLNTLLYANRAKNIKNKAIVNEDSTKDEMIRKCRLEVERLKSLLKGLRCNTSPVSRKRTRSAVLKEEIRELQKEIELEDTNIHVTSEKIKFYQDWKDRVENQIGIDILTYTNNQKDKIGNLHQLKERLDESNRELKRRIAEESVKIISLQNARADSSKIMAKRISSLSKTLDRFIKVKKETSELQNQFEMERTETENTQKVLLKHYKLNQSIVKNFVPAHLLQQFSMLNDPGTSENILNHQLDVQPKHRYIIDDSEPKSNKDHEEVLERESNNVDFILKQQQKLDTKYEPRVSSPKKSKIQCSDSYKPRHQIIIEPESNEIQLPFHQMATNLGSNKFHNLLYDQTAIRPKKVMKMA